MKSYTIFIEKLLPVKVDIRLQYFEVPVDVPDVAIDSLGRALEHLSSDCIKLNLFALDLTLKKIDMEEPVSMLNSFESVDGPFEYRYERIKAFEGDLILYAGSLTQRQLSAGQQQQVAKIVESSRALVYAAKTLKDVRHDFVTLQTTHGQLARSLETLHTDYLLLFYRNLIPLMFAKHEQDYLSEQVSTLSELNNKHHDEANLLVSHEYGLAAKAVTPISTLFNLNHELHHYARYMLSAIRSTPMLNT